MAQFVKATGDPELKVTPACFPKYQLLNSPWENKEVEIKNVMINIAIFFINVKTVDLA